MLPISPYHRNIAISAKLYPCVELGNGASVGDFAVIGTPPRHHLPGDLPTIIGEDAALRSHTVVYAGTTIGQRFMTGHGCLIREFCDIGNDVSIGSHSVIEFKVTIGDGVRVHSQAFIPEYSILEPGSWIGPNVVLTNCKYPEGRDAKKHLEGVIVGRGARVGANATILPGVHLGEGCLIGAGAVVTRDVQPGEIVVGNPAHSVGTAQDLQYEENRSRVYPHAA